MDTEQREKEKDQVLQEVGRMVRLGRLLRTRLKEAILVGDKYVYLCISNIIIKELTNFCKIFITRMSFSNEQPNASAIEAISKKLTEVTSLAEQLDAALRSAQDTQNVSLINLLFLFKIQIFNIVNTDVF